MVVGWRPSRSLGSVEGRRVTTIYGIKNCDTMKKARAWLDAHGVAYAFHDYKAAGHRPRAGSSAGRAASAGRRCSTAPARPSASCRTRTRRGLDEAKAIALMLAQPSMIKRPVLERGRPAARRLQARDLCGAGILHVAKCLQRTFRTPPPSYGYGVDTSPRRSKIPLRRALRGRGWGPSRQRWEGEVVGVPETVCGQEASDPPHLSAEVTPHALSPR